MGESKRSWSTGHWDQLYSANLFFWGGWGMDGGWDGQGRSLFDDQILNGDILNVANGATFWPTAEGNTTTLLCDHVVDWWPDEWGHPVGFHVTVPCTGAAYRTFDAAWVALTVGSAVQMHYLPDALRDRNRTANEFGTSSLCRTHSYGMPTDVLNPMRMCTQADNQPVDPTVPSGASATLLQSSSAQWGPEFCATSPYEVPWDTAGSTTTTSAMPPPAAVGTVPIDWITQLRSFDSWSGESDAPLRQCESGSDCCSQCSCLLTPNGGVCAVSGSEEDEKGRGGEGRGGGWMDGGMDG